MAADLHAGMVSLYSWPSDGERLGQRAQDSWAETVAALPLGTRVTGEVIFRQPFGVFFRIDGVPDAVGLAEIFTMPRDADLPPVGARIAGEVIRHDEGNYEVRVRFLASP